MSKFCILCFSPLGAGGVCPRCGFDNAAYKPKPHHLPPQTLLRDRYCVGKAMGEGGFGITYAGYDLMLKRRVAIKEYYPSGAVWRDPSKSMDVNCLTQENYTELFNIGRQKCIQEAQSLARLDDIPAIVRILDFFPANNTAYIIMEFVEGITLRDYVKRSPKKPTLPEIIRLLSPVTVALDTIHKRGFVHRDVSPDNIMITSDGSAKLLDFGAVKHVTAGGNATETPIVKRGFSPLELYSTSDLIGPWTDVYSLAATMFFVLVGEPLDEPTNRFNHDTAAEKLSGVLSPSKTEAMLHALALRREARQQSVVAMIHDLTAPEPNMTRTVPGGGTTVAGRNTAVAGGNTAIAGGNTTIAGNNKTVVGGIPGGDRTVINRNQDFPARQEETMYRGRPDAPGAAPAPRPQKSKLPVILIAAAVAIAVIAGVLALVLNGSGDKSGSSRSSSGTAEKTDRNGEAADGSDEKQATDPAIAYKTAEEEENNSFSTANDVAVNSAVTGQLSDDGDEDYFKFSLTSDGYVFFTFSHDRLESDRTFWKLTLYDAEQTPYMIREFTGDQTAVTTANIGLPAGVYYVGVSKNYFSDINYTLKIKALSADNWETERNGAFAAANTVEINTEFTASLTDNDDNDYFKFTTPSAGYVSFTFKHDRIDNDATFWNLTLYDASQTTCMARSFSGNQTTATTANIGLPDGTYYVRVNKNYFADINYHVTVNFSDASGWETEQNNAFAAADPIKVNEQITASLTDEDDNDYFVFTTPADGFVSFAFNHDRHDDGATFWQLTLYNEGQTPYMSRGFTGSQPTTETAKIGLPAGTYYVRINRDRYLDIAYHLTVSFEEASNWETEQNGEFSLADPMSVGARVTASLTDDKDNDYFKFTVNEEGDYKITLSHDQFDDGNVYWRVFLYSADQAELKAFDFHGDQATEVSENFTLSKGSYYMRVQAYRHTDRQYQLLIQS